MIRVGIIGYGYMGQFHKSSEAVSKIFKKFRWLISQPDGKENKNGSE